ncbi:hydro-lyase, Fe-S type, tartrate/fumarate subfamily, alpha subunit [Thermodesulfobium narugense DSM 14796]|uniref:Hydro-lyase, Fe-S type, tartrate/fumarate subfamily, alpha subunit n=1 Tax=Thermodesulfobium narugense DSM 14796 TaxID=747365 RepID=M1E769_9BACT|nr:fumarate hydratase [Thermodesulfobium narugense]AEE13844.1 hydro-lyase, Fe-S type, tartrate/fumarate subfamily, alpha subunit [Thermodesulfobium narugense DSM 14796]
MRDLSVDVIEDAVKELVMDANYNAPEDVKKAFDIALEREESEVAKRIFLEFKENHKLASQEKLGICQDTGLAVIFLFIGQDVHLVGEDIYDAINRGVERGYTEGYLRKSTCDPFTRKNLGTNTPAIVHVKFIPGDKVKIIVMPKGGGAENMSALKMFAPSAGLEGVMDFVVETVRKAGPNPCPPTIVGVGVGGNFERVAFLAKRALLRPIGSKNPDERLRRIEEELLERINKLGIGPMGLGGRITSLAVHLELEPCHIASLPVAVNIECNAHRHKSIEL